MGTMSDQNDEGTERDDLGRLGESVFEGWCSSLRWVANRATVDRRGFDFIVHIPFDSLSTSSLTKPDVVARREHLAAVQIKTTGRGRIPRLSLSTLRHLVEHPGPALVILMEIDQKCQPWSVHRAHALHLDRAWTEESIRRHWELVDDTPPNGVSLTIPADQLLPLDSPDANSFRVILQRLKLPEPDVYVRDKAEHRKGAGHGERPFKGKFTLQQDTDLLQEVAAWGIGLQSEARIPVGTLRFFEERFGMLRQIASHDEGSLDEFSVTVSNSPGVNYGTPCRLVFAQDGSGSRVEMTGELYHAGSRAPFLPKHLDRIRIQSRGLEITTECRSNDTIMVSYHIELPTERSSLRECIPIARVMTFLQANVDVRVEVHPREAAQSSDGAPFVLRADLPKRLLDLAHAFLRAQRVVQFAGVSDDLPVSRGEIERQSMALQFVEGVQLSDRDSGTSLSVYVPDGLSTEPESHLVVLMPIPLKFGRCRIAVIVAAEGSFDVVEGPVGATLSTRRARTRMVESCQLMGDPKSWTELLRSALLRSQTTLESEGHTVISARAEEVIDDWTRKTPAEESTDDVEPAYEQCSVEETQ